MSRSSKLALDLTGDERHRHPFFDASIFMHFFLRIARQQNARVRLGPCLEEEEAASDAAACASTTVRNETQSIDRSMD
jgi:hypothetical protein